MKMNEIKTMLDEKYEEFNNSSFIVDDPISIPHRFSSKEDIEISAFLTATISWGNRKSIIKSANRIIEVMDGAPFDFIVNHTENDLKKVKGFVHRTYNESDLMFFLVSLQNIYQNHNGLENVFAGSMSNDFNLANSIDEFKNVFFSIEHETRTLKHVSSPKKGSAAKRINMFLRWMVRDDNKGVDFGIWSTIDKSKLMIPLDVHTSSVGRKLGLLKRKANDWKSVEELTENLRLICPEDPIKYDFALFGLGAIDGFCK